MAKNKYKTVDVKEVKKKDLDYIINKDIEFWKIVTPTDKEGNEGKTKIHFNYTNYLEFLKVNNFYRYKSIASDKIIFVKVEDKLISEVTAIDVKDFTKEVAKDQDKMVLEMLLRSRGGYTGPSTLESLDYIFPEIQKSGKDHEYMYFKDQCWKITAEGIEVLTYKDIPNYMWKERTINFSPTLQNEFWNIEADKNGELKCKLSNHHSDWLTYLYDTSNNYHRVKEPTEDQIQQTDQYFMNKISAIGYLLHQFRDKAREYCVIAMDMKDGAIGDSNGGSGKSILGDAMGKIVNCEFINGKKKDIADDQFIFGNVNERTNLVAIDDIRMNFDFEFLYPYITGRFSVRPLGKQGFTLPGTQVVKIYITTNHAISDDSASAQRRQFFIGFSDRFNKNFTPYDLFKKNMFSSDWDNYQWNSFYNIMARSIQTYLKHGRINPPGETLKNRQLKQKMGEAFKDWADAYFGMTGDLFEGSQFGIELVRKELHEEFLKTVHISQQKYYTSRSFKNRMNAFVEYYNLKFESKKTSGSEKWIFDKKNDEKDTATEAVENDLPF